MLPYVLWLTRTNYWDHICSVLYWLSVSKRIECKILFLTYQCLHRTALQYLQELVKPYNPRCSFCFSFLCRLSVSGFGENTNKKRSGTRSFHRAVPTLWTSLPDKLHCTKYIVSSRGRLKSHLFSTLWSPHPYSSPSPHPLPRVFLSSPYHPPHPQHPLFFFFFIFFAKCNEHLVFLPGVRLCSTSRHWHWYWPTIYSHRMSSCWNVCGTH